MTPHTCKRCGTEFDRAVGPCPTCYGGIVKTMKPEYSTNCMDLSLDIGMTIQKIQAGEIDTDYIIPHLEEIRTAVNKISERLSGG